MIKNNTNQNINRHVPIIQSSNRGEIKAHCFSQAFINFCSNDAILLSAKQVIIVSQNIFISFCYNVLLKVQLKQLETSIES